MPDRNGRKAEPTLININRRTFLQVTALLAALLLLAVALTYIVPRGDFGVLPDGGTDYTEYIPRPDRSGIPVWRGLLAPVLVFFSADGLTLLMLSLFLFIISAAFQVMNDVGGVGALIGAVSERFRSRKRLLLLILALVILLIFIFAFLQEKAGNFTINLDRLELFRKGIAISADAEFTAPTSRLTASEVPAATNISINDLPFDLDDIDGDHSGANYMAYTYYVRNAGKEDVNYIASLTIDDASKGVEDAVRVAVWHNGERTVYAEPAADGSAEDGCVSFVSRYLVFSTLEEDFLVGNVNKYTVVIWLEGDDPECVDAIVGGSIDFTMSIKAENEDDTSLLSKWVRDLFDTLSGNNPISAGGTESPDFYSDVNWWTRRNQ